MGEDVGKPVVRLQVPEDDPEYLDGYTFGRRLINNPRFGELVSSIDSDMQVLREILDSRKSLISKLGNDPDDSSEEADRLPINRLGEEGIRQMIDRKNQTLRQAFKKLAIDLEDLFDSNGHYGHRHDLKRYIAASLRTMFDPPEIQDELRKHFGDNLSGFTINGLWLKVNDGSISDELLYTVVKRHIEDIREQSAQLQKIFEETKAEFKTAVTEAVDRGTIPQAASAALHRIDSVVVFLSDRLLDIQSPTLGHCDDYGRIGISSERVQASLIPEVKHTIFHELLHILSGRSITLHTEVFDGPDRWGEFTFVSHRKGGVALKRRGLKYSSFVWLNEAITEWLALELSGYSGDTDKFAYKDSSSYTYERQELDRLFASGLERETVMSAYFENFVSDQPKGEKGRHFTELVRKINEIEGPAGFTKIENKHIMSTVEDAMYEVYVKPAWHEGVGESTFPQGSKTFRINVKVGKNPKTQITREFVYVARPITDEIGTVTADQKWDKVKHHLDAIKEKYGGKVDISVVEE